MLPGIYYLSSIIQVIRYFQPRCPPVYVECIKDIITISLRLSSFFFNFYQTFQIKYTFLLITPPGPSD